MSRRVAEFAERLGVEVQQGRRIPGVSVVRWGNLSCKRKYRLFFVSFPLRALRLCVTFLRTTKVVTQSRGVRRGKEWGRKSMCWVYGICFSMVDETGMMESEMVANESLF